MHIPQRETSERVIAESLLELLAAARPSTAHNCAALRVRARKSYHLPFFPGPFHRRLANYRVIARFTVPLRGGPIFSEWNYMETPASRQNSPFLVGFPDYYYSRSQTVVDTMELSRRARVWTRAHMRSHMVV